MITAEMAKAALDAIEAGDLEALAEMMKEALVAAASGEAAPAAEPPAPSEDMAALEQGTDEPPDEEEKQMSRVVLKALGRDKIVGAASEAARLIALGLEAEAERAKIEGKRRVELTARLVELRAETPATAWEGEGDDRRPSKFLREMSIEDLEARVKAFTPGAPRQPRPPTGDAGDQPTEREAALIKKHNMTKAQAEDFLARNRVNRGAAS